MAKTIEEYYNIIIAEKNTLANLNGLQPNIDDAQTLLSDIKSPSKVEDWRLVFWCIAVVCHAVDVVCDLAIIALESIVAKSKYGSLPWYVAIMKEYQHGDALVLVDYQYQYATENLAARVIKLAAAQEGVGIVNLKVAKIVGGVTQALSVAEYNGADAYIKKRKPAGIKVALISDAPDDLILNIESDYDPLLLTATGELISTPGVYPLNDALDAYLKGLDFNGAIEIMKLQDALQKATGIVSVYITGAFARYGANPFVPFSKRYVPNAGYAAVHVTSTKTYTPAS